VPAPDLKAILFDVDDTLFSTTDFAKRARGNAVRAMVEAGLAMPEQAVQQELREVLREFGSNYTNHYDKLLMRLPARASEGRNPALIVAAGVVAYHDTKFRELEPFDDVRPFLRAAGEAGIVLGIVTHGLTPKQAEKLIRLDLVSLLDPAAIFISDQVGISKPNPKLFALAARRLGLEPGQCMVVGDNLTNDIAPARELGMHTVWAFRSAKEGQDLAIRPDHKIENFRELARILRDVHGIPVAQF
jgi:putative hydrolase of the HAD superfamily